MSGGKRAWPMWLALIAMVVVATLVGVRAQVWLHDPARSNPDKSIVLLTTSWCPYCSIMRNSLQQSGVPFRELDIETSREGQWAFRASGARGIPVTLIGQRYVSGGVAPQLQAVRDAGYPVRAAIPPEVLRRLQARPQ